MPEDESAENPEGESDDSDNPNEEEENREEIRGKVSPDDSDSSSEDSVEPQSDESDPGDEEEFSPDEFSEGPSEQASDSGEDLSPEELAEEALDDVDINDEETQQTEDEENSPDEPEPGQGQTESVTEEESEEEDDQQAPSEDDQTEEEPYEEESSPEETADEDQEPSSGGIDDPSDEHQGETESEENSEEDETSPEEEAEEVLDDTETEGESEEAEAEEIADEILGDSEEEEEDTPEELTEETPEEDEEESIEDEDDQEELSPEELAEEVLEDTPADEEEDEEPSSAETDLEEPSEQPEMDDASEEIDEDEPSPDEEAEEVLEDTETEGDTVAEGGESEEAEAEEIADEVLGDSEEEEDEPSEEPAQEVPEESGEEDEEELSPEELAESVLEEEEEEEEEQEGELDEPEGATFEEEPETEETVTEGDVGEGSEESKDETTEEELEAEEDTGVVEPEPSDEGVPGEESEESDAEAAPDKDEDDSIQDMLEEEAERAREEEEEEEDLPEGYLTVEQLPEEEEFEVPQWLKITGWFLLYGLTGLVVLWYLLLPLWETYLLNQVKASMERGRIEEARNWVTLGTGWGGYLIKNDDVFRADYLHQLLDIEAQKQFPQEHDRLNRFDPSPYMDQVFTQYLLNQGKWSRAMNHAEELQRWIPTRGQGYLMHGKAVLELGQYEQLEADVDRATQWLGDHPGIKRLLRDLRFRQGDYQKSLQFSNELQGLVEDNRYWSMKVQDYLQLARANKQLNRHRVAQRMLERALDLDPRNDGVLKNLGKQYILEGRHERADPIVNGTSGRPSYRDLYPLHAFGWWGGAELAQSNNRVPRSIRFIERAEDLEPRNAEVHRVKGELYGTILDLPGQAVPEFERARELGIDRLRLVKSLAQAQYQFGQYQGAVEVYSTLQDRVGDTRPDILYNLGSAYLGAGEHERSEELIQKAHDLGYRNQNSFNQWGLSLELQGQRQLALAKYVEGIEWGERNNEPIGRIRQNLNRALAQNPPSPLGEWLAPVEKDLGFQPWATLSGPVNSDTVPST